MSRFTYVLIAVCAALLAGCGNDDHAKNIVGKWEMLESRDHPRHNPPTETIEFAKGGGFVLRMDGKVEMEGSFRVERDKLILTHTDGQTSMGNPMTIKTLTATSLVLTSEAGKDSEFVRK
jgi:uncharacterized protein (TIGR03066 family)